MKFLLKIFYGSNIVWALEKDVILKEASTKNGLIFSIKDHAHITEEEEKIWKMIGYLIRCEYLTYSKRYKDRYVITELGKDFLSNGGFTAEVKKSKNDIFSFRISIVAIVISLVSLFLCLFDRFVGE